MMIPTQIQSNIVREDMPAVYAYYIVKTSSLYPLALVCDNNNTLVGIIGNGEIHPLKGDISKKTCGQICNRSFIFLEHADSDTIYQKARNIFSEKMIKTLPIVKKNEDEKHIPVGLFGDFQAFFLKQYRLLPHWYYAYGLLESAQLAKSQGYDRMSAIEFGVAGGNGLVRLGAYAREVSRIFGIQIDVYGFDSGEGMLASTDYRDVTQKYIKGDFKMDVPALNAKLYNEKLILGDICDTSKIFFSDYAPAPIGFISVDVDTYTPTVAILDMLLEDDKYFLPSVLMYFDDVFEWLEHQGEALALREFNAKNEHIKIGPEYSYSSIDMARISKIGLENTGYAALRFKWCHRFNHPNFSTRRTNISHIALS